MGLTNRVRHVGWLEQPNAALAAADVLLLPSESEGFGLVCVEAMLAETPVIRTRSGGAVSQIVEGVTGWSCAIDDHAGFCELVTKALHSPSQLCAMGQCARTHALEHFTEDKFVSKLCELYNSALGSRSPSASSAAAAK